MTNTVARLRPFQELCARRDPTPLDLLVLTSPTEGFNRRLREPAFNASAELQPNSSPSAEREAVSSCQHSEIPKSRSVCALSRYAYNSGISGHRKYGLLWSGIQEVYDRLELKHAHLCSNSEGSVPSNCSALFVEGLNKKQCSSECRDESSIDCFVIVGAVRMLGRITILRG